MQNDHSGEIFLDQLLAIGNRKLPVDSISGHIQLPPEFCNLVTSKNNLVEKVFPNILTNYKNHKWLSKWAILAAKQRRSRNQHYYSGHDSRPGSHLQVSQHSSEIK